MARRNRRPDPPPLETDDVTVIAIGTGMWAVGLVVLAVLELAAIMPVPNWWMGMCGYGVLLGLVGLHVVRRRHSAIARDADRGVPRRS